ncbi:hypothetical protein DDZ14_17710 [Maritimibacter sp. 55A14]|uniref:DUF2783 domain-containing protein n=1 Tax=Maritimibacter sp. 55A14 TaxID=2174844 RepID=UPI000D609D2C|nr:DUF2783 domain-containing protein [Maritimibacter sp. 55A14]PWE29343.1 hypothetical protein DDZ14_17710 [Maritimibacter sp. 55A14]
MSDLILAPNLDYTDDFYADLLNAHDGLTESDMHELNARLVLILANHIGDQDVLSQALDAARRAAVVNFRKTLKE